jgi:hypothetical protein
MAGRLTVLKGGRLIDGGGGSPLDDAVAVINGDPLSDMAVLNDRDKIVKVFHSGREVPRLNYRNSN